MLCGLALGVPVLLALEVDCEDGRRERAQVECWKLVPWSLGVGWKLMLVLV